MNNLSLSYTKLFLILCSVSLALNCFAHTKINKHPQQKLQQIQQQIKTVQSKLEHYQSNRNQLENSLKTLESKMGDLNKEFYSTQQKLADENNQLAALEQQRTQYQTQLQQQQKILADIIKQSYILQRQNSLAILLKPNNSNEISRAFTYYQYLAKYRINAIKDINSTLANLEDNKQAIAAQLQTLSEIKNKYAQQKNDLNQQQHQRLQLMKSLDQQIQSKSQQLANLQSSKKALEKLIAELNARSTYALPPGVSLTKLHGKLHWPTRGKIIVSFGTPIEHSELKQQGVVIAAPTGQKVYAIAPGKVVFANWLSGYGLLIIIDHGQGLMSLYGRNSTLYQKVGDTVQAGDLISAVGDSGGFHQAGLYFAIRQKGTAVNPNLWCKGFPPAA